MQQETRNQACSVFKWALKLSAAAVVAALLAVAVVSIVLNDREIASHCDFCPLADCVEVRHWWTCSKVPALQPQASCTFDLNSNATTTITCPSVSDLVSATWVSGWFASGMHCLGCREGGGSSKVRLQALCYRCKACTIRPLQKRKC